MANINAITGLGLTVGELAVKHGIITAADLEKAVKTCADLENKYDAIPEYLVAQTLISQKDCDKLFSLSRAMFARGQDVKFGSIAIKKGFITQSMLDLALDEQTSLLKNKKKYALLGNILVDAGMLTPQQRDIILSEQNRYNSINAEQQNSSNSFEQFSKNSAIGKKDTGNIGSFKGDSRNFAQSEVFPSGIRLIVKGDGNAAYLLKNEQFDKDMSIGQIKELLASRNIIHGIVDNASIQKFIDSDIYLTKPFRIAQGNAPIEGQHATVQYFFTKNRLRAGTIREDGTIDFRERGNIPQVEKGAVLAIKKSAVQGQVGKNIFNDTVRVMPTRDIRLKAGKGATLTEDKLKVIAAVSGQPKLGSDGTIYVYDTFVVNGDVDFKTGNIDYQGDVNVKGCIQNGFRVKAHNVRAEEIDGATVIAQGNIVVQQGINQSKISAQGSLSAKFIQNSIISCVDDIKTDKEVVESNIECSGMCNIRGLVIASKISAKMGVYAKQIGVEKAPPSVIRVGVDTFAVRTLEKLKQDIEEIKEVNKKLIDAIGILELEIESNEEKVLRLTLIKENYEDERMDILSSISSIDSSTDRGKSKHLESELNRVTKNSNDTGRKLVICHDNIRVLRETIEQHYKQVKDNETQIESFVREKYTLSEWIEKNPGIAVIKVDEYIMAGTYVHGKYADDKIKSSVKGVFIREDQVSRSVVKDSLMKDSLSRENFGKDNIANLWKMYITKV
ncbi:MAG: DUF342 domain-containing protein [Desulfamplus sp.]|nr:DUF342 domain-containing protein [Desulfamplus sp.]